MDLSNRSHLVAFVIAELACTAFFAAIVFW
jgi:hypothetical protein